MSVLNGAEALPATLDSVLDQQDCDFEFIVVNDGSTDASACILDRRAAGDPRLRVIHQANTGLTLALIRGCNEARGDRKSTRLNSSHTVISYAVFCLKK